MKRNRRNIFKREWFGIMVVALCIYACANRGYPEGGPKDETPPQVVEEVPLSYTTNFKAKRVNIYFDEFVQLNDINNKFIFSPPVKKDPKVSLKGKYVQVAIPDSLRENTTYSLDFADAIVDNNESNPLGFYRYVFSTGERIDTLELGGTVVNAESYEPVMGVLVALYEKQGDSIPLKELPDYIARTDSSGNFRLTNLREGHYRVMAIEDANRDKMYAPESEMFAWMDTTVFPVVEPATRVDTFHVIEKIVEADTILRDSIVRTDYLAYGPSNLYLRLFLEKLTQLYLVEDDRKEREQLNFIFSIPGENGLEVTLWDTLATEPLPQDWYFKEHSAGNDTLTLWIKDSTVYKKDTLNVILSYMRSDSTGQWERYSDTARYTFRAKEKKEGKSKKKDEDAPKVEFLEIKSNISGDLDLGARLYLEFSRPINKSTLDSIRVLEKVDTVYQLIPFQVVEDSLRVRRVFVDAAWKAGGEYQLQIDSATIYDIYGRFNDKLEKKFKVRTEEYYGKIMVNVRGVDCPTIVQLYKAENGKSENGKRTYNVVQSKVVEQDGEVVFPLLPEGKYCVRAILDRNGNGVWDTGLYLKHRQPEEIVYLRGEIAVKQNFDVEQDFDIGGEHNVIIKN
ncbi:MAG TPA: Ig-like domain-containing protein [Candidatus Odoribacter faecigallinarum]|uniref:Ig-like domain-containing protein n=1 Tax=Candidatus Odoribacter faecigallinarum TaxID=2838706 RepID=A0A9D1UYP0_9BACT|nr:Ig-like domain-containing protein [Candidatus Odoribacter faecigallinarum]